MQGGFQPCAMEPGASVPVRRWERHLVAVSLLVHVVDVGLDLLVVLLFLGRLEWGFFFSAAGVILWAWLVSSLYVSFGNGAGREDAIDADLSLPGRLPKFFLNFVQVQIVLEAYRCVCCRNSSTDYFYTLRLMEAILESAPSALVQLLALIVMSEGSGPDDVDEGSLSLLRLSICVSIVSVGFGLAMWEQKVQFRASSAYVAGVAIMRAFEIASRSLTLAIFAAFTYPSGIWWALLIDYGIMVGLIAGHQSVQITYGLFVALPLVLVSLEPLVWRWEDHAVPKDSYYLVRIIEFVAMWSYIIYKQELVGDKELYVDVAPTSCKILSVLCTFGLYSTLPCVWRIARRHEFSRDVADWGEEDGVNEGLRGECSDSDMSSGGSDQHLNNEWDDDGELPPE